MVRGIRVGKVHSEGTPACHEYVGMGAPALIVPSGPALPEDVLRLPGEVLHVVGAVDRQPVPHVGDHPPGALEEEHVGPLLRRIPGGDSPVFPGGEIGGGGGAVGVTGGGVLPLVLVPHAPAAVRKGSQTGIDDPGGPEAHPAEMLPVKQIVGDVVLDPGVAAPIDIDALDVGDEHVVAAVLPVVDDLRSPEGVLPELEFQIQRAPVVPVAAVLRFRDADGAAVAVGHALHLLIRPPLGVEHIIQAVRFLPDDHGIGGSVEDGILVKRCRNHKMPPFILCLFSPSPPDGLLLFHDELRIEERREGQKQGQAAEDLLSVDRYPRDPVPRPLHRGEDPPAEEGRAKAHDPADGGLDRHGLHHQGGFHVAVGHVVGVLVAARQAHVVKNRVEHDEPPGGGRGEASHGKGPRRDEQGKPESVGVGGPVGEAPEGSGHGKPAEIGRHVDHLHRPDRQRQILRLVGAEKAHGDIPRRVPEAGQHENVDEIPVAEHGPHHLAEGPVLRLDVLRLPDQAEADEAADVQKEDHPRQNQERALHVSPGLKPVKHKARRQSEGDSGEEGDHLLHRREIPALRRIHVAVCPAEHHGAHRVLEGVPRQHAPRRDPAPGSRGNGEERHQIHPEKERLAEGIRDEHGPLHVSHPLHQKDREELEEEREGHQRRDDPHRRVVQPDLLQQLRQKRVRDENGDEIFKGALSSIGVPRPAVIRAVKRPLKVTVTLTFQRCKPPSPAPRPEHGISSGIIAHRRGGSKKSRKVSAPIPAFFLRPSSQGADSLL